MDGSYVYPDATTLVTQNVMVPDPDFLGEESVTLPVVVVVPLEVPVTNPDQSPVTVAPDTFAPESFLIHTVALA